MTDVEVNQELLKKSLEKDLKNIKEKDKTVRVIEKEETSINGRDSIKSVLEYKKDKTTLRMQVIGIACNNKTVLEIGGSCSSEVFEEYESIFDYMINSIIC